MGAGRKFGSRGGGSGWSRNPGMRVVRVTAASAIQSLGDCIPRLERLKSLCLVDPMDREAVLHAIQAAKPLFSDGIEPHAEQLTDPFSAEVVAGTIDMEIFGLREVIQNLRRNGSREIRYAQEQYKSLARNLLTWEAQLAPHLRRTQSPTSV